MEASAASHHAAGSCSAQPGRGVDIVSGVSAVAATAPLGETRIAFTPLVPTSMPRKSCSGTSAHSEDDLHGQLIEPLVRIALRAHRLEVEALRLDGIGILQVADPLTRTRSARL